MSAFMFFSNDQRAKVKEDNPGIAFGEVRAGAQGSSRNTTPALGPAGLGLPAGTSLPGLAPPPPACLPHPPPTPHPRRPALQVGKVLGQRWKELSAEDRKPYDQQAEQDKASMPPPPTHPPTHTPHTF
jgi:hypothetical protein